MSDVTDRLRTSKDEKRKLSKEVLQKSTKLGTLEKQVCFYVKLCKTLIMHNQLGWEQNHNDSESKATFLL